MGRQKDEELKDENERIRAKKTNQGSHNNAQDDLSPMLKHNDKNGS